MTRGGTWNSASGEDFTIGRHTVRLKRSLGEGGFAFIHLVEVGQKRLRCTKYGSMQQPPSFSDDDFEVTQYKSSVFSVPSTVWVEWD